MATATARKAASTKAIPASFTLPILAKGEIHGGLAFDDQGIPSHWLIAKPGKHTRKDWNAAMKAHGDAMPTRQEMRLLVANAKQHFKTDDWYWTSEQPAGNDAHCLVPGLQPRLPGLQPQGRPVPRGSRPQSTHLIIQSSAKLFRFLFTEAVNMRRHSGQQQLKEAKEIAKAHHMYVVEKPIVPGETEYIVYRRLPDGRSTRVGSKKDISQLRRLVSRLAESVPPSPRRAYFPDMNQVMA